MGSEFLAGAFSPAGAWGSEGSKACMSEGLKARMRAEISGINRTAQRGHRDETIT